MALFNILVDIAADTAKFESGIKRVENQLESLAETAKTALEFAGVATTIAEVVHQFDEFIERAESLEYTSQKVGETVAQLSSLQFAAQQSGVSTDTLTSGLEHLARSLGQAANASSQQALAFRAMGIDIYDTSGKLKSMDDILLAVADKFAGYKDSVEKTALAQVIFQRGGDELIPILNKGAAGIAELRSRSDELGATIGGETSRAAEEFNSKLGELHALGTAFWQRLSVDLLPALSRLVEYLTDLGKATGDSVGKLDLMKTVIEVIEDDFRHASATVTGFVKVLSALSAVGDLPVTSIGQAWTVFNQKLKEGDINLGTLSHGFGLNSDAVQAWAQSMGDNWSKVGEDAKTIAPVVVAHLDSMANAMAEFDEKLGIAANKTFTDTQQGIAKSVASFGQYTQRIPALGKTMWDKLDDISQEGARGIQTDFEDFLFNPAQVGFKGLLLSWVQTIDRMVAKALSAELFDKLFPSDKEGNSSLGGIFGDLLRGFGAGSKSSGGGSYTDVSVDQYGAATGFATGGSFTVGGSGGTDSQNISFRATPGEMVNVTRPGDQVAGLTINLKHEIDFNNADSSLRASLPAFGNQIRQATKQDLLTAFKNAGLRTPRYA